MNYLTTGEMVTRAIGALIHRDQQEATLSLLCPEQIVQDMSIIGCEKLCITMYLPAWPK